MVIISLFAFVSVFCIIGIIWAKHELHNQMSLNDD